ncbi:MAG TPA: cysteine desulfurase family protein [Enterovirga sp.]|nr:cysteine desulfurase family protein [Enterovirga sp.]
MSLVRSYLDHNAGAPLRPEVAAAMVSAFAVTGNPSSVHAEGRRARALVEQARAQVAALVGAAPENVVFTSGGTEANNLGLASGLSEDGARLLVSPTEHPAVLMGTRAPQVQVERLAVDGAGVVVLGALEATLARGSGPALVAIQVANNETGVVQPLREAAELARRYGARLHTDAVQAAGRVHVDISALGVDSLALSAHKLGGPTGVGALIVAEGREVGTRLVSGGGQERGRRGGTENVAGIVGFGLAAEIAARDLAGEAVRFERLRTALEGGIRQIAPEAVIFGEGRERLPNTVCFAIRGLKAETTLIALDLDGVAVSSGAACSSGKVRRSHVLEAMGVAPELAEGAIRVSLGWNSTDADVARFAGALENVVQRLYQRRIERAA